MKKSLGAKGELFPQSVFIIATYDEGGTPNAMNAAWAGECGRDEACFNIGGHKTTENIVKKGAFTVAPANRANVVSADYFGIATGSKVNKADGSGLTFTKSEHVDAPVIEEYPLTMECEVVSIDGDEHGARVVGRVVNVLADEGILDDEGRVDFDLFQPLVYDATRRIYRVVGEEVGGAWNVGRALMD